MPIYEYRCADCQRSCEVFHTGAGRDPGLCPHCRSQKLQKVLSVTAPPQVGEGAAPCDSAGCGLGGGAPPCASGHCPHGDH